ncbi:MAG: hypothetical protein BA872_03070 [Desulfobacterales bacterium C00003060]|nr:MAG: hypothetical protein BA861_06565 [Desulfobacterales bacterium S3730MH5]OEU78243.1 MAG: hypothetical protein BA865_13065 [Desulfobacterales bacterium S5133MH4]OEU78307.1 MAG: hypothetical protein BA872_03070 [Desulfobacterales bacterium C00003060]
MKLSLVAAVVTGIMLAATPAMALDVEISPSYETTGALRNNQDLYGCDGRSDARLDTNFKIHPVLKVTNRLSVVTGFQVFEDQVSGQRVRGGSAKDKDFVNWKYAYCFYANYDANPATLGFGYAFSQGNTDSRHDKNNWHPDRDLWEPLLILSNQNTDGYPGGTSLDALAKGKGFNGSEHNSDIKETGYKLAYVTAAFSPRENVILNAAVGYCETNDTVSHVDNEIGWEYDIGINVKLMDNLTYNATVGYLVAGDAWNDLHKLVDKDMDDSWAFLHGLTVTF